MILSVVVMALIARAEVPEPKGSPITREPLAAIMKHPTEPHYDPLRPMSGHWVRCRANGSEQSAGSIQDMYSSSDRSHFSQTVAKSADGECKTIQSEERTNYECSTADEQTLSCKILTRESKVGDGAWSLIKMSESDLAGSSIKLSFIGLPSVRSKKARARLSESSAPRSDGRKLELRIIPSATGEIESVQLRQGPKTSSRFEPFSSETRFR